MINNQIKKLNNVTCTSKHLSWVLGIDGGGSSSSARLINLHSGEAWDLRGGAVSLTNDFDAAIRHLEQLCDLLCAQAKCQRSDITAVFGVAGSGNQRKVEQLNAKFKSQFFDLTICSDAKTSAYGANAGEPVVVVALGTGSVGMRLESPQESILIGGWGFVLGDEGGGAKLALHAIQASIAELEQNQPHLSKLATFICRVIAPNRDNIITWISHAKPSDLAQYAIDVFALYEHCPQAKMVIDAHIASVEDLIGRSRSNSTLPVVLLGGLASATQQLLSVATSKLIIKAKGTALDGACLLAKYAVAQNLELTLHEEIGNSDG